MPGSQSRLCLLIVTCFAMLRGGLLAGEPPEARPSIREIKSADGQVVAVEAGPFSADMMAKLDRPENANKARTHSLSVYVEEAASNEVAIVGSYSLVERSLRFTPRFAFRAGQAYRAIWRTPAPGLAARGHIGELIYRFDTPASAPSPATEVTAVFPSAAVLPENQLRFYIHFSAPMARGAAYEHLRLLDSRNRPLDLPFLELGQELWDPRQQRLTLLLDPGRIKRGVKPREDLGHLLRAGEEYTLIVQSTWLDADNRPLRAEYVKRFRVGPPIEGAIDPAEWRISAPPVGSRQPLTIDFPRPLDHALLERLIGVRSASGEPIDGEVQVSNEERRWELRPKLDWSAGQYEVVVDAALEDLAGNRIGRAFEVDEVGPNVGEAQAKAVRLPFTIRTVP